MAIATTEIQNSSHLPSEAVHGSIVVKDNLGLSLGNTSEPFDIEYSIYGHLARPVIVVLGGITADRHVLGTKEHYVEKPASNEKKSQYSGWWGQLAGANNALSTDEHCIVSFNYISRVKLKSSAGNSLEYNLTPLDQAIVLKHLLDALGVSKRIKIIGSSYGGMVGLSFAEQFNDSIEQLTCISASDRSTHTARAIRAIQKGIFELADNSLQKHQALSLARQLSVLFYRTDDVFDTQFIDPAIQSPLGKVINFDQTIYSYLNHQGQKFANKTSIGNYEALLDSIDAHSVNPENIQRACNFIAVPNDRLVSYESMRRLAQNVKGKSEFYRLESIYGHDAFLKEFEQLNKLLKKILGESDESSTSYASC